MKSKLLRDLTHAFRFRVCGVYVYVCTWYTVYVLISVCTYACTGACVGARIDVTFLPQSLSTLVLRQHLSLNLKVTILTKLTSH